MANPNIVAVTTILGGNAGWNLSATATDTLMTVAADVVVKLNRVTVANVDGTNAADVSWDNRSFCHIFYRFNCC